MKYCIKCNLEYEDKQTKCIKCGKKLMEKEISNKERHKEEEETIIIEDFMWWQ